MGGRLLATLLLLPLLGQRAGDPDPAALVERLGSPRYAERSAAGEALVQVGRAALPALAKAAGSPDLEVRLRAEALVARIEANALLDATRVEVDVRDRPLAEAVATVERASGMTIRPAAAGFGTAEPLVWPDRRATLQTAGPVPFWDALDALCRAGGLRREFSTAERGFFPFRSDFAVDLAPGRSSPPRSDAGSLRVELLRVRHRRERDYGIAESGFGPNFAGGAAKHDPATGATENSSYAADLLVSAEPRLLIFGAGPVEGLEVVDDRGRSLLKSPDDADEVRRRRMLRSNPHLDPSLHPELRYGPSGQRGSSTVAIAVPLAYPSPPARRIARLRGVIPLLVLGRRPDPLTFDLKGAAGREFSSGPVKVTVHKVEDDGNRAPTVELTLDTGRPDDEEAMPVSDPKGDRLAVRPPADLPQLRLEVVDARGRPVFWQFTSAPDRRTQGRMTIVLHNRGRERMQPDGLRVRCWELVGAATDLPFAFQAVPTP